MKKVDIDFFTSLLIARPVGSAENVQIQQRLAKLGHDLGCWVEELPFDCYSWQYGLSSLTMGHEVLDVLPSPFSPSVFGTGDLLFISSIADLRSAQMLGKIVVLYGDIAVDPITPKDFPFYEVPEHLEITELLECGKPLAILSAMGKHPMCGLDPCPMFEDCHFTVPSAYFPAAQLPVLQGQKSGRIDIVSTKSPAKGNQLILHKPAVNKSSDVVILCGHMDTAYNTPGALDNAVGLFVTLAVLEQISEEPLPFNLQVVPFNGEDYSEVSGERAYLARYPVDIENTKLVINIDDAGHKGSMNALSFYNIPVDLERKFDQLILDNPLTCRGEPWYASDHTIFAAQGVPCIAFASSDLMAATTSLTHTLQDTLEQVDFNLVKNMVDTIYMILKDFLP